MAVTPRTRTKLSPSGWLEVDAAGTLITADGNARAALRLDGAVDGRAVKVLGADGLDTEEHERRTAEDHALAALDAVSRELIAQDDHADVDAVLVRAACAVTGATGGAVYAEHDDGGLVVSHAAGWNRKGARVPAGSHSGAALVHETGEPLFAADAQSDARLSRKNLEQSNAASVAIWPVRIDGRTAGAVLVWWAAPMRVLSSRTQRLLETVSSAAAVAIERRAALGRLELLSRTDALTGISNRRAFDAELERRLAERASNLVAVALLDLDHFKAYNDRLGHLQGDSLLRAATLAWHDALGGEHMIARFGGEEFAVIVSGGTERQAWQLVERLRELTPGGQTCSAGVAVAEEGETSVDLLARVDHALYRAKAAGRDTSRFADKLKGSSTAMAVRGLPATPAHPRFSSVADLRDAMENHRFTLHYQSVHDARDGRPIGYEALVRCVSSDGRLISPADFVPLAERTGYITTLGHWVIESACGQVARWQREGLPELPVSINVSPRQLDGPDLAGTIANALSRHGVAASKLYVEITESALVTGSRSILELLGRLKAFGVRSALDDFGAGQSSLGRLAQLPVGLVKIDRSLVRHVDRDPRARSLLQGVISLVRSVGATVVVEGIETSGQQAVCAAAGAVWHQGFFYARPQPPEVVTTSLPSGLDGRPAQPDLRAA